MNQQSFDDTLPLPTLRFWWTSIEAFGSETDLKDYVDYVREIARKPPRLLPSGFRAERCDAFGPELVVIRTARMTGRVVVTIQCPDALRVDRVRPLADRNPPQPVVDLLVDAVRVATNGEPTYEFRDHAHRYSWNIED